MRIVIFSNTYKPTISGVVTSIDLFRRGLIEAGHDVHVFAPEYHDYVDEDPYIFRYPAVDLPKGLDVNLAVPDSEGGFDPVVETLSKIDNVDSVEVVDVGRI